MSWKKFLFSKPGLVFLLAAFGGMAYLLAGEALRRYEIEKEIFRLSSQILEIEKRNSDLSGVIEYLGSASFAERELRRKRSLQKPGEHVVVLPAFEPAGKAGGQEQKISFSQSKMEANWKEWWNYFFKQ